MTAATPSALPPPATAPSAKPPLARLEKEELGGAAVAGPGAGVLLPHQPVGLHRGHDEQEHHRRHRLPGVRLGPDAARAGAVVLLLGVRGDAGAGRHAGAALRPQAVPHGRRGGLLPAHHPHPAGRGLGRLEAHVRAARRRGPLPGHDLPLDAHHDRPLDPAAGARTRLGARLQRHLAGHRHHHGGRGAAGRVVLGLAVGLPRARRPGAGLGRAVAVARRRLPRHLQRHQRARAQLHRGLARGVVQRREETQRAVDRHHDVAALLVAHRDPPLPELRPLDPAHADAQLHEERAALRHQAERPQLGAALPVPAVRLVPRRLPGAGRQRAPHPQPHRLQEGLQLHGTLGRGHGAHAAGVPRRDARPGRGAAHRGRGAGVRHAGRLHREPRRPVAQLRRRHDGRHQLHRQHHGHHRAHLRQPDRRRCGDPQSRGNRAGLEHGVLVRGQLLLLRQPVLRAGRQRRGAVLEHADPQVQEGGLVRLFGGHHLVDDLKGAPCRPHRDMPPQLFPTRPPRAPRQALRGLGCVELS